MNNQAVFDIRKFKPSENFIQSNGDSSVTIKKKQPAKIRHGVLIAIVILGGVLFISNKMEERFN